MQPHQQQHFCENQEDTKSSSSSLPLQKQQQPNLILHALLKSIMRFLLGLQILWLTIKFIVREVNNSISANANNENNACNDSEISNGSSSGNNRPIVDLKTEPKTAVIVRSSRLRMKSHCAKFRKSIRKLVENELLRNRITDYHISVLDEPSENLAGMEQWIRAHQNFKLSDEGAKKDFESQTSYDLIMIFGGPTSMQHFQPFSFHHSEIYFDPTDAYSLTVNNIQELLKQYSKCTKNFGK